ncbi:MAG: hypothetical protein K0S24_1191 [Sphingobacterium sp.]|jgi:hypothetical protein|nr:hypothetical protein [Sphingobacterium sp.]
MIRHQLMQKSIAQAIQKRIYQQNLKPNYD